EPLPKLRSICESAASRAFDLSMEEPSTRRRACGAIVPLLMTGIPWTDNARPFWGAGAADPCRRHCTRFVLVRNMFFARGTVLAHFHPKRATRDFKRGHSIVTSRNCNGIG